jgi:predicted O-methyltransferase YrrM
VNNLKLIIAYLHYYFFSKTKFNVHSPFVFNFITEILEDKKAYPEYQLMNKLSKTLLADKTGIQKNDLGAGSKNLNNEQNTIAKLFNNTALNTKYSHLLFRICNRFQPEIVVELGTGFGMSTCCMSVACNQSKIFTIEGNPSIAMVSKANFQNLQLYNVDLKTGNFDDELPKLLNKLNIVNLAFIDGNHQKNNTIEYFNMIAKKCNNDSIIMFDDIRWSDEMFEAWHEIINDSRVTLSFDLFRIGIVFFRKEQRVKEHFVLKF